MHNQLKIATIMDEFTFNCYAPECELLQVTPDGHKDEIDGFAPDLFFIETAWRGKDELWNHKLYKDIDALKALASHCRSKNIPIVFWSKEDPGHFSIFIETAALADFVFTTDADCIELYKAYLGHNNVYYLPFAAQPVLHNPIEEYERQSKFCFAGSFYSRYKSRSAVFMELIPLFKKHGLDIYDRNFNKDMDGFSLEYYTFPSELKDCIRGNLPYSKISLAYKGYRYGINMTSMVHSGFMFARRVFELLASNTLTVSNYSRGMDFLFGDLIIATNSKNYMEKQLEIYHHDKPEYRKFRLAGLRHVLADHLYEDRLDRIARIVLGRSIKKPLPKILVVSFAVNEAERKYVAEVFEKQTYDNKQLMFADDTPLCDIHFDFLTVFSSDDYYGKNYLTDFALATRFSKSQAIGKGAYYTSDALHYPEKAYTVEEETVCLNRQMVSRMLFDEEAIVSDLQALNIYAKILFLDEFNYCQDAHECELCEDLDVFTGMDIDALYRYTDTIKPVKIRDRISISTNELYDETIVTPEDMVEKSFDGDILTLTRNKDDDAIVWLRTRKSYNVSDFTVGTRICFRTETIEKYGSVRCQIEYYDSRGTKLDFLNFALDGFSLLRISDGAKTFKLIFRLEGNASVKLKSFHAISPDSLVSAPATTGDTILITEKYTSYGCNDAALSDLHNYVRKHKMEVLKVSDEPRYLPFSEVDGVRVVSVVYDALHEFLNNGFIRRACLYNPSERLLSMLRDYEDKIEIDVLGDNSLSSTL